MSCTYVPHGMGVLGGGEGISRGRGPRFRQISQSEHRATRAQQGGECDWRDGTSKAWAGEGSIEGLRLYSSHTSAWQTRPIASERRSLGLTAGEGEGTSWMLEIIASRAVSVCE